MKVKFRGLVEVVKVTGMKTLATAIDATVAALIGAVRAGPSTAIQKTSYERQLRFC
jgi:hypothetical protein